jgi:hypothetical protein
VSAAGYLDWKTTAVVPNDGARISVSVPMLAEQPKGAAQAVGPTPPPSAPLRPWQGPVGITAMAVGGAALAVGGVLGGLAISKKSESNKTDCSSVTNVCSDAGISLRAKAITFGNASTALFIAGGVIAGAGIIVFATAPRGSAQSQTTARLVAGPFGVGVEGGFE